MDAATALAIADSQKNKKALADAAAMANRNVVTSGSSIIPDERSLMHAKGMEDQFTQQAANKGALAVQDSHNQGAMDLWKFKAPFDVMAEQEKAKNQADNELNKLWNKPLLTEDDKLRPSYSTYNEIMSGRGRSAPGVGSGTSTSTAPAQSAPAQSSTSTPSGSSPSSDLTKRRAQTFGPSEPTPTQTKSFLDAGLFGQKPMSDKDIDAKLPDGFGWSGGGQWRPSGEGMAKSPGGGTLKVEDGSGREYRVVGDGVAEKKLGGSPLAPEIADIAGRRVPSSSVGGGVGGSDRLMADAMDRAAQPSQTGQTGQTSGSTQGQGYQPRDLSDSGTSLDTPDRKPDPRSAFERFDQAGEAVMKGAKLYDFNPTQGAAEFSKWAMGRGQAPHLAQGGSATAPFASQAAAQAAGRQAQQAHENAIRQQGPFGVSSTNEVLSRPQAQKAARPDNSPPPPAPEQQRFYDEAPKARRKTVSEIFSSFAPAKRQAPMWAGLGIRG